MIDPRSPVPRYRQVAESVRRRIRDGEWRPGTYLPGEAYLASEYGVGRDAMRDAVAALRHEGVLIVTAGQRSMVPPDSPLELVRMVRSATLTLRMPTYEERTELDIREGVPVAVVEWGRPAERRQRIYPGDRYAFTTE